MKTTCTTFDVEHAALDIVESGAPYLLFGLREDDLVVTVEGVQSVGEAAERSEELLFLRPDLSAVRCVKVLQRRGTLELRFPRQSPEHDHWCVRLLRWILGLPWPA